MVMTGDNGGMRNTPKRHMSFGHVCFFSFFIHFYITVLTFFLATMHSFKLFSDNCHLFWQWWPQMRRPQTWWQWRNEQGNEESAQKTLYHISWAFFFFYFHIANYILDMILVVRHPTPLSLMMGIIYHNDREQWGNERGLRGYKENAQETLYNVSWACSKFFFLHLHLLFILLTIF